MGFILDGLETEDYDRQYRDRELIGRIVAYFAPHWRSMLFVVAVLVLASLADAIAPVVASRTIDLVAGRSTITFFLMLAGIVSAVGTSGWLFNFLRQRTASRVVGDVVLAMRDQVFRHAVFHDMSFYDQHPAGKVISRITSDTQDFSTTVTLVIDLMSQLLMVAILTVFLVSINWMLTLVLFVMAPVAVIIALSFRRLARRVTQNAKRAVAVINGHMQESIGGITVAKSFRQEERLYRDFRNNNRVAFRVGLQRGLVINMIFPLVAIAAGVGTGTLVYVGGLTVQTAGEPLGFVPQMLLMTPGQWWLFLQAVGFFWWPMLGIASFYSQFQDGLAAAERVFALIDAEPVVSQSGRDLQPAIGGAVGLQQVSFAYTEKEQVLDRFSLDIAAGETVAFVGHTGAGKSSVARLVTRFYEFQDGTITIDGHDIRDLDLAHYRRSIGIVPQTPFLFSGTVADNIRYGTPDVDEAAAARAAALLAGGDWIEDLPNGLATQVGERGASISAGQRQLVALARLLLKDPKIFILDEATASIDPFTEAQIQEGLDTVMSGRTSIVIAHRLSTVKTADRIVVLDGGRIREQGDHAQLLAADGYYAELYRTYFRHQSLAYIEGLPEASD